MTTDDLTQDSTIANERRRKLIFWRAAIYTRRGGRGGGARRDGEPGAKYRNDGQDDRNAKDRRRMPVLFGSRGYWRSPQHAAHV